MNKHDMAYGDFKDLARRAASDKAFNIAKNDTKEDLLLWFRNFLIKNLLCL